MINNTPSLNQTLSTVSTINECDKLPIYSQQQLKLFDPSFSSDVNKFKEFFLPPNTKLDIPKILLYQKRDPDLKNVYTWITQNPKY